MWKMRNFIICTHLSLFVITNMLSNYLVFNVHLSYNHSRILLLKKLMVQALFRRALYTVHKWHTAALLRVQGWILLIFKVIYTTYPKEIPVQLFARCLRLATILIGIKPKKVKKKSKCNEKYFAQKFSLISHYIAHT